MTRFTPECLARTDFPRLIGNDPSAARKRLESLVADPEALSLYEEKLSSRELTGRRLTDSPGWDELRHRILRQGLGELTLDEETLALLAQDYDALIELQFDLFSAEEPHGPWQRALAEELVDGECSGVCCDMRNENPSDQREVLAEATDDFHSPDRVPDDTKRDFETEPLALPGTCFVSHRMSLSQPVHATEAVARSESLCVFTEACFNFQRCLVDRRGWLHWSSHTIDHHASGHRTMLLVHCDTWAAWDLTSRHEDIEWACPAWDTFESACRQLFHLSWAIEPRPQTREVLRPRPSCRGEGGRWLRWIQRRMPFLRPQSQSSEEAKCGVLREHIALLNGSFSTCDMHWTREGAGAIVVLVNAATELASDDVMQLIGPDPVPVHRIRAEEYTNSFRCSGLRSTRGQHPGPWFLAAPRRELTSTF